MIGTRGDKEIVRLWGWLHEREGVLEINTIAKKKTILYAFSNFMLCYF
jgi:hypothetical protein